MIVLKKKKELKSLTRNKLIDWFQKNNIQGFRAKQVFNWIYKNGVNSLVEMENLPSKLIDELTQTCHLMNLKLDNKKIATDGTLKYLWQLEDGETVESVYLPYEKEGRHSVCISTQIGCAMGCKFCATGTDGLIRDLTVAEIIDQILKIQHDISDKKFGNPHITNVVFMGMGEPLANLDAVLESIKIINDNNGLNIGMRKITVSTAGLVPGINILADKNLQLGLAISLNAPNDDLRNQIMPINKKYPLDNLMQAVRIYINKTNRRVTFEYVLMKGINDSKTHAYQLINLVKNLNCHINLIPVNPVSDLDIERPSSAQIEKFKSVLDKNKIQVSMRQEKGVYIKAACGQLRSDRGY